MTNGPIVPIQPGEVRAYLHNKRCTFTFAPRLWQECHPPVNLEWERIPFGNEHVNTVPNNECGVYSFMLQPEVFGIPETAYLLYIGKTSRSFQKRYKEYLKPDTDDWAMRPIYRALEKWADYVWFYFAPIGATGLIETTEETLMNACIPPLNRKFTGTIGRSIGAFIRDPQG